MYFQSVGDDYFSSCRISSANTRFYMLNANGGTGFACTKSSWPGAAFKPSSMTGVEYEISSWITQTKSAIKVGNNNIVEFSDSTTTISQQTIPLFGAKLNDSSVISQYSPNGTRCYYAKFYIEDYITRDLIPVEDKYGTVCMYDKVSNTFFYNKGTGSFIAGPEKQ